MIRRKLAPLLLALGLLGGVAAVSVAPQPASAAVIKTLWNGNCAVKIGFGPNFVWAQVWTTGCRGVWIEAADSRCYCFSYQNQRVNASGLAVNTYFQTGAINHTPSGAPCWNAGAFYAFVTTVDNHGWTRDGVVDIYGRLTGW